MRHIVEFGLYIRQRGAPFTRALRIAGLRHETIDHTVEQQAVIKARARQSLDPRGMVWRLVGPQEHDDRTAGRQLDMPQIVGRCGRLDNRCCHNGARCQLGLFLGERRAGQRENSHERSQKGLQRFNSGKRGKNTTIA